MSRAARALLGLALAAAFPAVRPAPPAARGEEPDDHVGSARCRDCHAANHAKWASGRHSRMIQPAGARSVLGDFARGEVRLRGQRFGLRAQDGRYFVREEVLTGRPVEREVAYTLGSRRVQHYLATLEDGRMVVLPPTWDVQRREWFHNLEIVDPEESDVSKVQVWNTNCFGCHVSRQEKNYDPARGTYATRWQDYGIACERCHGPGGRHAADHAAERASPAVLTRASRLRADRSTMVCGQCHSLRDITAPGFEAGADYHDHFTPILEFAQRNEADPAYWPDGRPRRFSNDAVGLWQSRCFLQGGATCLDCHRDPHALDVDQNPEVLSGDRALCLRCHAAIGRDVAAHTRHAAGGAGSSCVECHMPKTVVSIRARMRDHSISVPAPLNTARFGIPNACNECHRDRSPAWAQATLVRWGQAARARRLERRAEAFQGARQGRPGAGAALRDLAWDRDEGPLTRANALGHLRRFPDAASRATAEAALGDEHALPRALAALTLGELVPDAAAATAALTPALSDPARIVRMGAAFSLVNKGITRLPGEAGRRLEEAKGDYARRAAFLNDDAGSQLDLGKLYFLDRDYERAGRSFEDALRLDGGIPGGRYFLGLARLGQGRLDEARRGLLAVPEQDPFRRPAREMLKKLATPSAGS
jgi:hypothetical protein